MYISVCPLWILCFIIITLVSSSSSTIWYEDHVSLREINTQENFSFPKDFLFGTASSAYQYEGAYLTDGKTLSNWDAFTSIPGKIADGTHGKVAVDHYHRYPEDLDLMQDLGVNSYRFSLSWARILPKGRLGDVNMEGIDHYNRMINAILKRGMEPFVTLTHYDIPQELELRYKSWLSPQIRESRTHPFAFDLIARLFAGWPRKRLEKEKAIKSFPKDFLFGTASSAYQYEGAYLADGKTLSNWDVFTSIPGKSQMDPMEKSLLIITMYIRWKVWRCEHGRDGAIYHFDTLYDTPQELELRYGSLLDPQVREDFEHYAEICFRHFGNRVKFWTTLNEPNVQVILGYRKGTYPPSRCSKTFANCTRGGSDIEPLVAAHNIIRSHLAAVNLYRTKFQEEQRGKIGIVMNTIWFEPVSDSLADRLAAERAQAFYLTWFLDPVVFGRYPREMKDILGEDLPRFTKDDFKSSKNGLDFIGINQYTSRYAKDCLHTACKPGQGGSRAEGFVYSNALKDGLPLGEPAGVNWFNVYPQGMEEMLMYATERYRNIPLNVTENDQRGKIGIVMNTIWFEPVSDSLAYRLAAERAQAFYLTWFLDPVVFGRYPREMKDILGEDLPKFTKDDLKSSKSGLDFIGIYQYTSRYTKDCLHTTCEPGKGGSRAEGFVYSNALKAGLPLGEPTGVNWFNVYPQGMEEMLMYATERYRNIPLYVTENGFGENNTGVLLDDYQRVKFMSNYLDALKRAMRKGANVRGYFTWSLLDNFEWISGFTIRFGMYHVDFDTLERTPRLSASWYKNFIFNHIVQAKDNEDA
ncbi:hypothetical protein F2Q68_00037249 [Brassica cretica]|uniref:Sinigrinase n=1 Tax=Brassica cretica TaxID=69181 RepID=A0A8S9H1W7_BRACR|nr:hypothetical protein F2Q68_00037249 [Brassica cretica]